MLKQMCNKYKLLFVVQILIILVLLPKCFSEYELVYSMLGEDYVGTETQAESYTEISGDSIRLTPGIYRVCVWSNVSENQGILVEVKTQDEEPFRSILSNAVTVYPGDEYIDFEVCVTQEVSTACIVCRLTNMDVTGLTQLDLYKTNMGSRIVLFAVLIGFGVLNVMLYFRERILDGKVSKEQQVVFWALAVGVLLAFFPYLTDYVFWLDDTTFHLSRIAFLKDSLLQGGQFPVRVQSTWLYDHGYAVSLFYGELFLYIPALLMIIGLSLMDAYKIFILLMMIATAIITYVCLKKCVKDSYAALFGSIIYILASYRLVNVYSRGATGEFSAMTFLPLICCGMYLLYTQDSTSSEYKKNKWYVIWGMSGILQSHLLSAEMVVGFMALVCVVGWRKTIQKKTFLELLLSVGLTVLINAWFLIPLLYMMGCDLYNFNSLGQNYIEAQGLLICELFQFLPQNKAMPIGLDAHVPAHVGIGSVMLLVLYLVWHIKTRKGNKSCNVFFVLSLLALLLCTGLIPWDTLMNLPVIGFVVATIQFPWRFMSIASVSVAMFATLFYARVSQVGGKLIKMAVGIGGVVAIIASIYYTNEVLFAEGAVYMYEEENMGTTGVVSAEYSMLGDEPTSYYNHLPVVKEGLEWSKYEKRGTSISVALKNPTDCLLHMDFPLIGYKGYAIEAEGVGKTPYITEQRGAHGDLRIAVPAGYEGRIQISYKGFVWFRIAEMISLVTFLSLLGMYLYKKRIRLRK